MLTVGELTRQIKGTLERGFSRVLVRGEISGFRGPNPRGHLYFSLKDADACIDAKVWASVAQRLKFKLRDGLSVMAEGTVDVYEPQGRYSLIVSRLEPVGEGALALAFQQLKERLAAEGLFGDKRKKPVRPLPFLPRRIGVVTSTTGAALRDFLRVLHGRHPRLSVLVCDARVQGDGAAGEVVRAIERLSRTDVDVIVVTRGGGSIEDLWTFNEESVARAIFACPVPVVSAIGHEIDFTIADFVADFRAPTPSAAAERLAPVLSDLELGLMTQASRLRRAMERQLLGLRQRLERQAGRLSDPRRLLGQKRLHLSAKVDALERALRQRLRRERELHRALADRLVRQRPQSRLQRNRQVLAHLRERLHAAFRLSLRREQGRFASARRALERCSPKAELQRHRRELSGLESRLEAAQRQRWGGEQRRFQALAARLEAMSPLKVMARGYSVVFRKSDGRVVRRAADVAVGEAVAIRIAGAAARTTDDCEELEATITALPGGAKPAR